MQEKSYCPSPAPWIMDFCISEIDVGYSEGNELCAKFERKVLCWDVTKDISQV